MSKLSKIMSMQDAVADLVKPGGSIVMGAGLEACIPFAVGHEIIRREIKDLTLVGPISDMLFDMMVGGRVVSKIIAAWIGNVSTGIGYNFRRAVENGVPNPVFVEDHSNLSITTALDAGAMGVDFGVIKSLFGTDILKENENIVEITCPFTGKPNLAVKALNPDLAVIHVQRSDKYGNAHIWGNLGFVPEAVKASRKVLVVAEEIVEPGVIRSDPNRTLIPGFKVEAVVHEPWGAHPSPVQGYYGHDDDFYVEYATHTKDYEDSEKWFEDWIFSVSSRDEYLRKLNTDRLNSLKVKHFAPSAPVEYGY